MLVAKIIIEQSFKDIEAPLLGDDFLNIVKTTAKFVGAALVWCLQSPMPQQFPRSLAGNIVNVTNEK